MAPKKKNGKAPRPKSTKHEQIKYVETIFHMIVEGYPSHKILRYASEKWNMSERSYETYLARARKKISEMVQEDMKTLFETSMKQMESDYHGAKERGDHRLAKDIKKEINDIGGLRKYKFEGTMDIIDTRSPEQVKNRIEELEKKRS